MEQIESNSVLDTYHRCITHLSICKLLFYLQMLKQVHRFYI